MGKKEMAEKRVIMRPAALLPYVSDRGMPYIVSGITTERTRPGRLMYYWGMSGTHRCRTEYKKFRSCSRFSCAIQVNSPGSQFFYGLRFKQDGETDWHEFSETVERHYIEERPGQPPVFPSFRLGPCPVNGTRLYRLKPQAPPRPAAYIGTTSWPADNWFADIYASFLNTYGLSHGEGDTALTYKIKLEVFDKEGNRVPPGDDTFRFVVSAGTDNHGLPAITRPANIDPDAGDVEIEDNGFIFTLRIDSQKCTAVIDIPVIRALSPARAVNCLSDITDDAMPVMIRF